MRKLLLTASIAFAVLASNDVVAQQGFGTNEPNRSAAVDIVSGKRGLLIPRVELESLTSTKGMVTTTATDGTRLPQSLLVYNNGAHIPAGYYYWDQTLESGKGAWARLLSSSGGKTGVEVLAGNNITVDTKVTGTDVAYTVHTKGGANQGDILVTIENPWKGKEGQDKGDGTKVTPEEAKEETITKWVSGKDLVKGENGV